MKKSFKLFASAALSALALQSYFVPAFAETMGLPAWSQRSVESIKQDLAVTQDGDEFVYTIQWGDTLSAIAEAMGMSTEELAVINAIENPDFIVSGSKLVFNASEHTLTIENQEGDEVAYSLEDGSEIALEETIVDTVDEWVEEEIVSPASTPVVDEVSEWVGPEQPAEEAEEEPVEEVIQPAESVEETEEVESTDAPIEETVVEETPVSEPAVSEEVVTEQPEEPIADVEFVEETGSEEVPAEIIEESVEEVYQPEAPAEEIVEQPVVEEEVVVDQGSLASQGLSAAEIAAKEWIAQRESNGDYNAINPTGRYIGRYQLTASYLNGDHSPENQERVANEYVISRYGSWVQAQAFWLANGWY